MKYLFLALISCFIAISCSNDFDIIAPQKDLPIVYGLLTPSDSAQYLRVERAFVDPETSALVLAQDPNEIYYADATVQVLRESTGEVFEFDRVDGNLEGYPREEGVFATAPNYLYKINTENITLVEGEKYIFQLVRPGEEEIVTAETVMLEEPTIIRPNASTTGLDFDYIDDFRIAWRANEGGKIFDVVIDINYIERRLNEPAEDKKLVWRAGKNIEEEIFSRNGQTFYSFIAGALEANPDITRTFRDLDVRVISGGEEILEYVRIGQANLGISSSQEIPTFTNISQGLGLFSTRGKAVRSEVKLTQRSLDSLRNGEITRDLNF